MANHPNRAVTMHHFMLDADPASGQWDLGTINYLGEVVRSEFCAKKDTDAVHYDQHDGDGLDREFWQVAGVKPSSANVALTIVWKQ